MATHLECVPCCSEDVELLFWTGHQRDASGMLGGQKQNTAKFVDHLRRMRDQAVGLHAAMTPFNH